jgi:hypothetical protein
MDVLQQTGDAKNAFASPEAESTLSTEVFVHARARWFGVIEH